MENLNDVATILERDTMAKLMQAETENLDQPIRTKYMKMLVEDPPSQNLQACAVV